jgi:carbon-monoxide dehydrogenase large subunit
MERLIDLAARRHGFDRAELRRRNLAPAPAMPTRNPLGMVNDSGDYVAVLDRALARAEGAGFEVRRAAARRSGRYHGIGLANYIELNSGMPRERAEITVRPEGRSGGGHAAARCSMRSSRGCRCRGGGGRRRWD